MKRILFGSLTLVGGLFATATSVEAQALPSGQQFNTEYKFVAPPKEVKEVEWKASASAGFTLAAGNANVMTLSGSANASRNDGKNLIALDLTGLYALTTLPKLLDRDSMGGTLYDGLTGNGIVDSAEEVGSESKVTAGFFLFKGRYDRFFTTNNAGYLAAFAGLDIPASKKAIFGGQLGYSRQLFKTKLHELKAELGVDTTYNSYDPDRRLHGR
jgi:putative salt-induced outer membrane protein YdiY